MKTIKEYQPIMDSLTAHIALIDKEGYILGVNTQWLSFCLNNGGNSEGSYIGKNYLTLLDSIKFTGVCSAKEQEDVHFARTVAKGIRDILAGCLSKFQIEYPCDSDNERRWFLLTITPFGGNSHIKAVIAHEDITALKNAEADSKSNYDKLLRSFNGTIKAISLLTEKRDPYTAGHQRSVADWCDLIAAQMKLSDEKRFALSLGAIVHDIGKIVVPSEILVRPGQLSNPEYQMIQVHAEAGYEILKEIDFPWPIAEMVYQHHERLDGSGYPRKLKGDEICLEARIIAVADVYDAMTSHRPYRPSRGKELCLHELKGGYGTKYDKNVVDALLAVVEIVD